MSNQTAPEIESGEHVVSTTEGATFRVGSVMSPTPQLRWSRDGKLQQYWQDYYSSNGEWKDVPKEDEA